MHSFAHLPLRVRTSVTKRRSRLFAVVGMRSNDLGVLLACQVEAALLLGQLSNPPQHAFPLFGFCPLPKGHGFCHCLQDMQSCTLAITAW